MKKQQNNRVETTKNEQLGYQLIKDKIIKK